VDKTVYDTFPLKTEYFLTEKGKAVLKALEIYQKIGIDYMIEAG
jgi:DNA-binding HxlR family transcriptional regulator